MDFLAHPLTTCAIVIGAVAVGILVSFSPGKIVRSFRLVSSSFARRQTREDELAKTLVAWSAIGKKRGVQYVGEYAKSTRDPWLRKGLQLVKDRHEPKVARRMLRDQAEALANELSTAGRLVTLAGRLGLTFGMLLSFALLAFCIKGGSALLCTPALVFPAVCGGSLFVIARFLQGCLGLFGTRLTRRSELLETGITAILAGESPFLVVSKLHARTRPDSYLREEEETYGRIVSSALAAVGEKEFK